MITLNKIIDGIYSPATTEKMARKMWPIYNIFKATGKKKLNEKNYNKLLKLIKKYNSLVKRYDTALEMDSHESTYTNEIKYKYFKEYESETDKKYNELRKELKAFSLGFVWYSWYPTIKNIKECKGE